jgi:hypothetical protein
MWGLFSIHADFLRRKGTSYIISNAHAMAGLVRLKNDIRRMNCSLLDSLKYVMESDPDQLENTALILICRYGQEGGIMFASDVKVDPNRWLSELLQIVNQQASEIAKLLGVHPLVCLALIDTSKLWSWTENALCKLLDLNFALH